MLRFLTYALHEALTSLRRTWKSGIVSIATITMTMLVLGAFLVVTANVRQLMATWMSAAELSAYLADDITADQRAQIERLLEAATGVQSHEYVSKEAALARFQREFPDLADVAGTAEHNPFPASYEVRLRTSGGEAVEVVAARLAGTPGVSDVRFDKKWLDRLQSAVRIVEWVGWGLVLVLGLAACLTIGNIVRLACYARKDEIVVMELVGAPMTFVRGPFVMEGVLQGGLGAAVALAVLWMLFSLVRAQLGSSPVQFLGLAELRFLPWQVCVSLVAGGMLVGCLGAFFASLGPTGRRLERFGPAEL
jgi:cell division transport system permease protein